MGGISGKQTGHEGSQTCLAQGFYIQENICTGIVLLKYSYSNALKKQEDLRFHNQVPQNWSRRDQYDKQ